MTYALLMVFIVFSAVVGFGAGSNGVNIWGVLVFIGLGLIAFQIAYLFAIATR